MPASHRIRWAEAALQDVESIITYIATHDDIGSAVLVHDKVISRVETLSNHPERCRVVPELAEIGISDYRELIVAPYRICFRVYDRDVAIVSVLDGRRDLDQLLIDRALNR